MAQKVKWVVGIAGGSGSGKTYLAKALKERLGERCSIISQDNYYIDQSNKFDHDGGSVNFDHPSAIDFSLLAKNLNQLKESKEIEIPIYDFATHKRQEKTINQEPNEIIVVDGILIFTDPELVSCFDHKVFVQTSEDLRFSRRLKRDVEERGRTEEGVRAQFLSQVKPMHDEFVEPSRDLVDSVLHEKDSFETFLDDLVSKLS